jgi:hypothetical protein
LGSYLWALQRMRISLIFLAWNNSSFLRFDFCIK